MTAYKVDLEVLLAFADKLQAFERRVEELAARVDRQVSELHGSWMGESADAQKARHDEWMQAEAQMRESLTELREAAARAHRNYSEAIAANVAMWPA
ncbi:WXG100 family type VII secretion target [Mycolicibacterium cosmeticum]|uniref:WXG100 family type VII secretion target n=1 Tax=Mycolicibacterium cosmeticum TaxID=258533 RepID=UPI003204D09A